ncbi:unnamed protein product, partial [Mesorhabditis belari]|uniref:Uncharacterized protein n=1 Tax=Mesorhabditis belari TaxID=2138241 RepID=A0AAF3F5P0_9BILA
MLRNCNCASSNKHSLQCQDDQEIVWIENPGYVPPKSGHELENWECEDRPRIEEEMEKQNKLLKCLHEQIQAVPDGDVKKLLEERAWSVQQTVTALRRRRRSVAEPTKNEENAESESIRGLMLEEKQLLAVQTNLLEEIAVEKKQVAELCWSLVKLGYQTTEEVFPKIEGDSWESFLADALLEEAARSTLIEELARLKSECAVLRANLELAQYDQNQVTRF